ncbi:hypothetical protein KFL_006880070 [Klebsormidium nitens]|uniref:Uncharacterized protein n=1 Tax=Klebsormidium nitens TaxID=105231 RepID=A0A1Y1IIW9_KLENI|nr:hypothetical protein KFL_006880070 [Klebsormidium nitens]|eukprot:GAQ90815.1 hypothetical protein KFL_006880070 [Klebsormidium nitens]
MAQMLLVRGGSRICKSQRRASKPDLLTDFEPPQRGRFAFPFPSLEELNQLLETQSAHVLATMSDRGPVNTNLGPGVDGDTLTRAIDPDRGGPQKTLYKPVATKGVEAQTVFAFLDRPPVAAPSPIEPHLPLPSVLTMSRPSEPRAMEYRVNESETRVPKWMQKPLEEARPAPAFNLEEAPLEEEGAARGFERFQASLRAENDAREGGSGGWAEVLKNVDGGGGGLAEQLDPLLGKGSLPAWLASERPKSSSGGKNTPVLPEGAGKKGEVGGDKLATADERLERQRMLARERRQKIESRKERINQQRAQELEIRKARQKGFAGEGTQKDLDRVPSPLPEPQPVTALSNMTPRVEELGAGSLQVSPQLEAVSMQGRGAVLARGFGGVADEYGQRPPTAEIMRSPKSLAEIGGSLITEEERLAMQQTKLVIERLLQERGVFPPGESAPLARSPERAPRLGPSPPPPVRATPAEIRWQGLDSQRHRFDGEGRLVEREEEVSRLQRVRGFSVQYPAGAGPALQEPAARLAFESPLTSGPTFREPPASQWPSENALRAALAARAEGRRLAPEHSPRRPSERGGELDLSLQLGLPAQAPRAQPPAESQSLNIHQRFPREVEAAIRAHLEKVRAAGGHQVLLGRRPGGSAAAGSSSTNIARELSPRVLQDQRPILPPVAELRRRSPEGKRKRDDVGLASVSKSNNGTLGNSQGDSPKPEGRKWLSAAAAEIEDAVLAELERETMGGGVRQRGSLGQRERQ